MAGWRHNLRPIFQGLNRQGKTILFVTHELELAKHAQKIVYLKDGMIIDEEKIEFKVMQTEYQGG